VVSAKVLGLMKAGGAVVTIVEGAKKIFLDNEKASSATGSNQGEIISYPPPPGRISVMRPIRFKTRPA